MNAAQQFANQLNGMVNHYTNGGLHPMFVKSILFQQILDLDAAERENKGKKIIPANGHLSPLPPDRG